jgi:hypothetical protein
MQSRILLRGYAREGGTPSLATHPQNQEQQQQNQSQQQNQNQQQNQGRLHRGLDTPADCRSVVCRDFAIANVGVSQVCRLILYAPTPATQIPTAIIHVARDNATVVA